MRKSGSSFVLAFALLGLACRAAIALEALPKEAPYPADNPPSKAKVELGKKLFFDPRLSLAGTISCNTCHNVMAGGDDMRASSIGHNGQKGTRSSPTVWNAAFLSTQFWDGRAATLEDQARGPITNPIEMGMKDHATAVNRIAAIPSYRAEFVKAFGPGTKVTIDTIAKAIATYERTLITPNSRYDRFARGELGALDAREQNGLKLVQTLGCLACHSGPNFSGPGFQKFPLVPGTAYEKKYDLLADSGRFQATKNEADRGFWRVPSLRNVALTAPYFHNGSVKRLDEAVRVMAKTQLNRELTDPEARDIVSFLGALTGEFPAQTLPRLPLSAGESLVQD
jgi:cytochrome c peroxidase